MNLKEFQQELKELIFFKPEEAKTSKLWGANLPDRLWVYQNNTRSNWTDTVDHDFPLTRKQFGAEEWEALRKRYFIKYPPNHWELNTSMVTFTKFLQTQKIKSFVKELADYEWQDLQVFINRSVVKKGLGIVNPTAVVRVYQHQIFDWVAAGASPKKVPLQKPEVLIFYRDSRNTCHIQEADPLMLLMLDHFRHPNANLADLEAPRKKLLPGNQVSLETVYASLRKSDILI
jgi:hypothetical protein